MEKKRFLKFKNQKIEFFKKKIRVFFNCRGIPLLAQSNGWG
jgi:hypothetical protein